MKTESEREAMTDKPSPASRPCVEKCSNCGCWTSAIHPASAHPDSPGVCTACGPAEADIRRLTALILPSSCSSSHQEIRYTGDKCPLCGLTSAWVEMNAIFECVMGAIRGEPLSDFDESHGVVYEALMLRHAKEALERRVVELGLKIEQLAPRRKPYERGEAYVHEASPGDPKVFFDAALSRPSEAPAPKKAKVQR